MRLTTLGSVVLTVLVFVTFPGPSGLAEEEPAREPRTPEQAASAVVDAVGAGDNAALKTLAETEEPDPWLVADALLAQGKRDEAGAFAAAASHIDAKALPAYVKSWTGDGDARRRSRLAAAEAAEHPDASLAALGPPEEGVEDLLTIRAELLRGTALRRLRRPKECVDAYGRAAARARELGWWRGESAAVQFAGATAMGAGAFSVALEHLERWCQIERQREDEQKLGYALWVLGILHSRSGRYVQALDVQQEALEIAESLGDAVGEAGIAGNLGITYRLLGNYDQALAHQERAFDLRKSLGDETGIAASHRNISLLHQDLGNHARALDHAERSLAMYRKLEDAEGVASVTDNLGSLYVALGEVDKGRQWLEKALEMHRARGDRVAAARTLGNLGYVHAKCGEREQAVATDEEALKLQQAVGDRRAVRSSLNRLGSNYLRLGRFEESEQHFERALDMANEMRDRAGVAGALQNLARLNLHRGELKRALEYGEKALAEAKAVEKRYVRVQAGWTLAEIHMGLGQVDLAVGEARGALEEMSRLVGGLGETEGATVRDRWSGRYDLGCSIGLATGNPGTLAYFLERERAGVLLESLGGRKALAGAAIPLPLRREEMVARANEAAAADAYGRTLRTGRLRDTRDARRTLDAARDALETVAARIQRAAKAGAGLLAAHADGLPEIQARLTHTEVLVLYALTSLEAAALVITREQATIHLLGDAEAIDELVETWQDLNPRTDDPTEAVRALTTRLVTPLALPEEMTSVLISPHGALAYLPFALLLPSRNVAYVPSGTVHGLLVDEGERSGEGVLALGDPDYGAPGAPARTGGRLEALPATREEALALGDVVRLGRDATEKGLAEALRERERWCAVHLACHGLIDPERPMFSSLALTPSADDDGRLTALEILRMRIPADLVALSACQTARGRVYLREGIVGLTRAFMYAGTPRVICSLWNVDDEATHALMVKFYELWNPKEGERLGAAAALKRAQEYVRDHPDHPKWKQPYYWAAWVLWGLPD